MATGVQPSKFINYISQFKKVLVTRNNGVITQTFKIDSSIDDNYYFSIVNSNNQLISLEGRVFRIYGSLIDSRQQMHILFYSDRCTIENGTQMHFKIETYTSQYMSWVKSKRIIDLTIVEVANPDAPEEEQTTQVVLRDEAIAYKRPYIENQTPTEILQKVILTTNVPLTGAFGSGHDIDLTIGSDGAAFGTGLIQTGDNQLVIGQYNEADATKAFVIGNGEDNSNRSNAFTVDYQGNVEAKSITIDGQDVGDKVNQLENSIEAVSAAIPSVEGFATEQWVLDKGYITGVNLDPYATKDQLTAYATKTDLTVSATVLNNQISQLALNIPTKTSDLTNDSGYITGYTAGTGISISNQNVISIDGELGKTYYADETTLHLNDNNTFSVKSIRTKLNNGPGISLSEDGNGVVTITNTGGSGGGGGYIYTAGEGLVLNEGEDDNWIFSVDEAWFNQHIDAYTSGIQNLSAGTGLEIEDNIISLTAEIPSIDGLASEQWVEANFLSAIPSTYATKDYVDGSVSGKADLSTVQAVDDKFANYYTSAQVDQAIAAAVEDIPSTVYTGEDGIKVDNGVISLTATLSSITNDAGFITSADIPTSYVQQSELESVSGQLTNAIGAKANTTDVEAEFIATSAWANETFLTEHQSLSSYYTKSEVDSAIGTATNDMATQTWVDEQGYLTAHQSLDDYYNKTQVDTALALKADSADVYTKTETDTAITNATSGKANQSTVESLSTALSTAIDTKANSADVYIKTEVYTKGETDSAINTATSGKADKSYVDETFLSASQIADYYTSAQVETRITAETSGKVNKTDFNTVTGALSTAIDTKTTSGEVKTQIEAYGYQNATDVANAISGKADKSELQSVSGTLNTAIGGVSDRVGAIEADYTTSSYVTGQVNNLATGAVATNAANIGQLSTDLGTVSGKANANETAIGTLSTDLGTAQNNITQLSTNVNTISTTYATKDYVDTVSTNLSTELTGWVGENTLTGYTAGSGIEITEDNVINLTVNTVPSAVSQLVNDSGFITEADIPLSTSDLVNDQFYTSGQVDEMFTATSAWANETFLTEHQSLDNYYNKTEVDNKDMAASANAVDVATGWVNNQGYLTAHQSLDDYYNKTQVDTALALKANAADVYTKDQVDTISGNLHNEITGAVSGMATEEWVENKNYLTEIPSEYITETELATALEPYALSADVDAAIETASGNIETWANGKFLSAVPNTYATKEYVDGVSSSISTAIDNAGYLTAHQSLDNYYNKTQVDEISSALSTTVSEAGYLTEHQSLEGYALSADVDTSIAAATGVVTGWVDEQGYLTAHQSLDNYYNKTEVDTISSTLSTGIVAQIPSLNGYATEQWVDEQGYLTAHQSLSAYATSAQIEAEYAKKTDIPSIEGLATENYVDTVSTALSTGIVAQIPSLNGYATEQWVEDKHYLTGVDLTSYATKEYVDTASAGAVDVATGWVDNQGYLTAHQDLTNYALSADVTADIATATGVVTAWVDEQNYLTAHQSLANYATNDTVQAASTYAVDVATGWVDNKNYLTEVPDTYALKTDIPTDAEITGLAKDYVDTLNIATTYATKDELSFKANSADIYSKTVADQTFATKSEISDMATQTWVGQQGYLTEVPNTVSAAAVAAATGWVDEQNYLTGITIEVNGSTITDSTIYLTDDFDSSAGEITINASKLIEDNGIATINDIPTKTSDLTNDSGFITASDLPTVATLSAGMYSAISGDVEDQITGKGYQTASDVNTAINAVTGTLSTELTGWVDNQGYVTTDTTYTAGTGLKLTGTEFSLSAAGAGENKVLSSHDGVISWETNVAGGGGGTTYTAGTGIDITNDEISVKLSAATNGNIQVTENNGVIYLSAANSGGGGGGSGSNNLSDYNNDVPFLEAGDLTNKQRVYSIDGATITYDPNIEIFKTIYYTGGDVTLSAVTVTTSQVANGEVATFEEWITFNSAVTSISEGTNTLIGEWPSTIDYSKTHVLVRRLYNNNGTIVQYVSYAYNF